jgi:hypothetical protein
VGNGSKEKGEEELNDLGRAGKLVMQRLAKELMESKDPEEIYRADVNAK